MAITDKVCAIADAIRGKTGGTDPLTLDQMAEQISAIKTDPVLEPLAITENGDYTPGEGVDGFSAVSVNVESAGGLSWEVTEYIHSEDWPDATLGLASNFANLYCNNDLAKAIVVYYCEVTNNTQEDKYAIALKCVRYGSKIIEGVGTRKNGAGTYGVPVSANSAFFMAAGAVVTVRKAVLLEEF